MKHLPKDINKLESIMLCALIDGMIDRAYSGRLEQFRDKDIYQSMYKRVTEHYSANYTKFNCEGKLRDHYYKFAEHWAAYILFNEYNVDRNKVEGF